MNADRGHRLQDRRRLRATFDSAADLYQRARPEYPEELYDTLVEAARLEAAGPEAAGPEAAGLEAAGRLLEIGCATGKATMPLARRGFGITCIEIGADLAAAARRNLADFPAVVVIDDDFETWSPPRPGGLVGDQFALVFAATAWHWLDPTTRYRWAWELLRPGGHLAFWSATHVVPEGGDPFFQDIQDVYEEIGEGVPGGWAPVRPGQQPDSRAEIEQSGLFDVVAVRQYDWEVCYNAEEYLALLDTFSDHIAMEASRRDRLYAEIRRRLGQRSDGRLRRHWGAVLHVGRRATLS
ncbi:MAG: class I SAM-dependent methyltransferase [Acidimicrobiales bacterium]